MRKGWFRINGIQDGDRTLDDQVKGLESLFDRIADKRVLDLGAAEGLIAAECVRRGAREVYAWEGVADAVRIGRELFGPLPIDFRKIDLNATNVVADALAGLQHGYDVVLMLGILHKLQNPLGLVELVFDHYRPELAVVRTPKRTPGYVSDARTNFRRFDVDEAIRGYGYRHIQTSTGHEAEWCGYYERY